MYVNKNGVHTVECMFLIFMHAALYLEISSRGGGGKVKVSRNKREEAFRE